MHFKGMENKFSKCSPQKITSLFKFRKKLIPATIAIFLGQSVIDAQAGIVDEVARKIEAILDGNWADVEFTAVAINSIDSDKTKNIDVTQITQALKKPLPAVADNIEFDERFMNTGGKLDLTKYSKTGWISPGYYASEVRVNGNIMFVDQILFRSESADMAAKPCLTIAQILKAGISGNFPKEEGRCYPVKDLSPGITYSYEIGDGILDLSVPQIYINKSQRGIADQGLWDGGVSALYSQYALTTSQMRSASSASSTSNFLRLDNGASTLGWQWRNSLTINRTNSQTQTNLLSNYLRTDLDYIKGEFKLGNFYTSGALLDTVSLKGVGINSVDEMLPDDEQSYAPTIRGVAETNAIVTVSQNGQQVYRAQVAPGPFALNDVQAGGFSGSLLVTITEADGRVRSFLTPYNAVPQLVRKGRVRYQLASGTYTSPNTPSYTPVISQGTIQYGVLSNLTGYVGSTISSGYKALISGVALNTFLGGVGADITSSATALASGSVSGNRLRLNYSKILGSAGTNVNIVASRTDGPGFYNTSDAMNLLGGAQAGIAPINGVLPTSIVSSNARSATSINLTQDFGVYGNITLSGVFGKLWTISGSTSSYSASYRKNFEQFSLSLGANKQLSTYSQSSNTSYSLSISIPFGGGAINTNSSTTPNGTTNQASINGNFGDRQQYFYNVGGNTGGGSNNGNVGIGANTGFGAYNVSYNAGLGYSTTNLSASGGLMLHKGGITLAPRVNDTVSIVEAKNAVGARINGTHGPAIDWNGYAIVDSLRPYRSNTLSIDPKNLPDDVELSSTSQTVTPRLGSVTKAVFSTIAGRGIVFNIKGNGTAIPFGSSIQNVLGVDFGIIGQGGQAFLRGIPPEGKLKVVWSNMPDGSCSFEYKLPTPQLGAPYDTISVLCN